jgi:aminoglycoside phosphotransferase (APT) family kinase protein
MAWVRFDRDVSERPDLDPGWLARQLADRGQGAPFLTFDYEKVGRFSSDVWRVRPVGGRGPHGTLIVKQLCQPPRTGESLDLEAAFYERLAAKLPVQTPGWIGRTARGLVVTEVEGLRAFDFERGPEPGHAERAIDALAVLHAATWEMKQDVEWVPRVGDPTLRLAWQADYDTVWRQRRAELDAICPAFTPIGDALVGRLAETLAPLAYPRVLLHGDAHGENLPLDADGHVVFLDWESPRLGSPAFDVAVFTTMSYPVRTRRKVEQALVERHLRALGPHSVDWVDPWTDYRRAVLRRAARIVELGAQGPFPALPWVFERCATAAADHHAMDLIA